MTGISDDRPRRPRDLPDWLIGHGRHWLQVQEAGGLLGQPADQAAATLSRLRRGGNLFSPTRGGYVPVPPEFRSWGAVPASHFIDPWMNHLGHPYYVGLLSAAEALGIGHQRPQVFQVVTPARMRGRTFGRVRVEFIWAADISDRPTTTFNTPTVVMRVSTAEVTVLDLVAHPRRSGGLSNVATVLGEVLQDSLLDGDTLARVAGIYPAAVRQRTGWLLAEVAPLVGASLDLAPLATTAAERTAPTPLDFSARRSGAVDRRWNVLVNARIEPDL
jgi:predicted transcriptional regulator of viral defense system